jgi:ABC-type amino acid transport substrate-binding protein
MKKIFIGMIMLFCFSITAFAEGEIKYFSAAPWVPFLHKDNKGNFSGMAIDLMNKIAAILGTKATLQDVPWKRGFVMLDIGEMDVCPSVYSNDERREKYIFTESFITNETRIFVRADEKFAFTKLEDLKGKSLGKSLGASFGTEFDNYVKVNAKMIQENTGKVGLFRMLNAGGIDGVLMDYRDGMSYIKKEGIKNVVALNKPVNTQDVYMVISKKSNYSKKLPEINKIIGELKESGTIKKMAEKYY